MKERSSREIMSSNAHENWDHEWFHAYEIDVNGPVVIPGQQAQGAGRYKVDNDAFFDWIDGQDVNSGNDPGEFVSFEFESDTGELTWQTAEKHGSTNPLTNTYYFLVAVGDFSHHETGHVSFFWEKVVVNEVDQAPTLHIEDYTIGNPRALVTEVSIEEHHQLQLDFHAFDDDLPVQAQRTRIVASTQDDIPITQPGLYVNKSLGTKLDCINPHSITNDSGGEAE
jgi:hypothetical protein